MIKYNLKCINKHEFESWFSDSKEFERLKTKKLLECIFCNSKKVDKSIMSPRILLTFILIGLFPIIIKKLIRLLKSKL